MNLATVTLAGQQTFGAVEGETFRDLGAVLRPALPTLAAILAADAVAACQAAIARAPSHPLASAVFHPPIPNPGKILCVGLNYEDHRAETGRPEVAHPTLFVRFPSSLVGHGVPIVRPALSTKHDYEGELAIIIGRPAWRIPREGALRHVAGYACFNDGSLRDYQSHTSQFTPGKNFLASGAFGPCLVTADAFGAPGAQRLTTRLNGAVVQEASLDQMIFDIPAIIAYCASFTRLEPGDVIATGTPAGVGARRVPPLWMKPGDVVEVEIDGAGVLRNPVIAEA